MLEQYYKNNLVDKCTKKEFIQANTCETGKGSENKICPFCDGKDIDQDLYKHSLDCEGYEKALTQTICPICRIEIEGPMTLHLEDHIKETQTSSQIKGKMIVYLHIFRQFCCFFGFVQTTTEYIVRVFFKICTLIELVSKELNHFACLCRGFDFDFSKRKRKYSYTFDHFYSEKSSKTAK